MKQRFWWTTVALLMTACTTPTTSHAEQNLTANPGSDSQVMGESQQKQTEPEINGENRFELTEAQNRQSDSQNPMPVYEQAIAKIQAHEMMGLSAATLYVRNIPVLTFIGSSATAQNELKTQTTVPSALPVANFQSSPTAKVATLSATSANAEVSRDGALADPVLRARAIAEKLEKLNQSQEPVEITVEWKGDIDMSGNPIDESYLIKVNDRELVVINANTRLPDTTNDLAQDAIQVTNRLRRLIANAPAIAEIANRPQPKPPQPVTPEYLEYQINGWASWYGPGFHGRLSASGEVFDQNALTAAHLHLPFGTRVRVTNLNNGLSAIVRINDRGPYIGGRIIDLSAGAARAIGMMDSGVAPVRLDILGTPTASSEN